MDFALDETQRAIGRLARDALVRESDVDAAWKALGQAGLLSLAIPERLDGDGLGVSEVAVLLAEVGRAAAALPALSTLALGVLPVVRCGTAAQQDELLVGVATGDRLLTAALRGSVSSVSSGDGLSGKVVGVGYAAQAYRILVPAGDRVFLVDPASDGVSLTRTGTSGGAPEFTVVLDGVAAEALGGAGAAVELHRLAVAGACAYGDGLVAGALDLTAAHVRTREQFGKPLATFQAVAQQIADVYIRARTLHLAASSACWRLGAGLDADADLDVAAYWLAEESLPALHTCHHLHGGLGVDASYALHRYYSAVKDLVRLLGGVEHRLGRLGARIAG
ncbi:MAG: acyl-CoA dehydrogenase [Actinophytocola sp.]|uniref:acyl-CoA dehydrogenase family protein n=1 Tax=Actinophytocola sp. TaxID=1872138 RepID=UPI00132ADECC|nr:acyl-CoA dehydrogenase family protein [Actinophytocola sp.]MPZ80710.1 acyl-CoA dehydrogenase [Actinophytocola sp.]